MLTNGFVLRRLFRAGWLVLVWGMLCVAQNAHAATFTSVTSGDWDDGATWGNASPGVAGTDFPGNTDDAIIASGHTVSLTLNEVINDLTVNANATLDNSTFRMNVDGNYTVNGIHAGTGRIRLRGVGTTIGGTGTVTNTGSFQLHTGSKIIQASADLTVSGRIRLFSGITVTNSGSITALNRLSGVDASSVWENAANATLTVHNQLMNNGGTLTATAVGNTVAYVRTGTSNQTIKDPSGSTYHHLIIDGDNNNSRKRPEADIIINGDLTIDGSTFDVSTSNFQVTLRGNWNLNGNFNERDGTVVMAGTATQSINGTTTFDNLTISNASGVVLGTSTVQLEGTLSITSGTFETNGVLRLVSNASGSARIGEISGGGISGNLLVERYIANAATEWRFLTSPVSGRTLNDWNDDVTTTGFTGSDFPNFPVASAPFVSIYTYNEAVQGGIDDGFEAPGNITDAIGVGEGFFVYMGPTPLTVDVTGPANTGTLALPVTFTSTGDVTADGWNLVGNPHVSDVDWSGFTRSGMENRFWVWSPASGNYAVWDESSGIGTLGANGDIALGQAFWVHATSTPSLSIPESAKTTGAPEFFKTASDPAMTIRITAAGMDHYDEAVLRVADNATPNYDGSNDACKRNSLYHWVPSLSLHSQDSIPLTINSISAVTENQVIPLEVASSLTGQFTLTFKGLERWEHLPCLQLEDTYTGTWTDLKTDSSYTFQHGDTLAGGSQGVRFRLHLFAPVVRSTVDASCFGSQDGAVELAAEGPWGYWLYDQHGELVRTDSGLTGNAIIDNLSAGAYTYEVNSAANGCAIVEHVVTIDQPEAVHASFSASSESITLSRGGEVAFSNLSVNASAYVWNFGDGQTSTQPNPVHVYTAPGNYQVTLVAWQNACADTTSLNIGVSDALLSVGAAFSSDGLFNTSVRQEGGAFWVRMYSPEAQEVSVQIFDPLGRVIGQEFSVQPGRTTMRLPMHGQPTGNYMVRISTPISSKTHKVYLP